MRKAIKKYRIWILIELALLLLLLPSCFQKELLVYSDSQIVLNAEEESMYEGLSFSVTPGVYQVRVNGVSLEEGHIYVTATSDKHGFRTFRCNGATVFSQQESLDFEIYVLESLDNVHVTCSAFGTQACIKDLEVYRINWGSRILTFLLAVGSLLLDMLLVFREGIVTGRVSKDRQVVFWALLSSVLVAYFPYMTDYFSDAADIAFQWLRIEGLKETLLHGNQFPVRVQSYWLYDHGYAVSAFNGDLLLWIPVLFRLIGFSLMNAYKLFVLVITIMTALISYYSFKKCTKESYSALFGSVLYMLAPYRIYNFYNRGAMGEYLAMTFFPLIICGMYRLFTEDMESDKYKTAKWPLIIGLSCILQSHILSCEMIIVCILFVCILFYKRTFRRKTFLQLAQAAILCLLLNMGFWLPLLQMMAGDQYLLSSIISKNIQYMGTWFAELFQLYSNKDTAQNGMYHAEPFHMGIASLIILVVSVGILFHRYVRKKKPVVVNPYDKTMLFWTTMIIFTWLLSTRYFPWDLVAEIPVVSILTTSIQFPTQLFTLVTVFSAIGGAFFFLWFAEEFTGFTQDKTKMQYGKNGFVFLLLILAFFSAVYHVNDISFQSKPIWLYNGENMGSISFVNGEYLLEGTEITDYSYHHPVAEDGLEWADYEKEGTSVRMYVQNSTEEEKYLELPLIGYMGYVVEGDNGRETDLRITEERGQHGDLRIAVPASYAGYIEVNYRGLKIFHVAELVSALTVLGIAVLWISRRIKWKTKTGQ